MCAIALPIFIQPRKPKKARFTNARTHCAIPQHSRNSNQQQQQQQQPEHHTTIIRRTRRICASRPISNADKLREDSAHAIHKIAHHHRMRARHRKRSNVHTRRTQTHWSMALHSEWCCAVNLFKFSSSGCLVVDARTSYPVGPHVLCCVAAASAVLLVVFDCVRMHYGRMGCHIDTHK